MTKQFMRKANNFSCFHNFIPCQYSKCTAKRYFYHKKSFYCKTSPGSRLIKTVQIAKKKNSSKRLLLSGQIIGKIIKCKQNRCNNFTGILRLQVLSKADKKVMIDSSKANKFLYYTTIN